MSGCAAGDASLHFDGIDYNRLPRGVALDNTGSSADGNFTIFLLDHVGGDLDAALTPIGTVNGNFYDDTGTASAFSFNAPPQFFGTFDPGVPSGIPTWFEAYPASALGMCGSALKFNANAVSTASAFSGGHNLHVLTLATDTLTLDDPPVSTPTRTATRTASATATNPAPTFTRTRTPTVPLPTATRTATATPTLAATATISASATRTATATPTLAATATSAASATRTDAGPTATSTPTPTAPTPTGSVSPSPSPTEVPLSCAGDCNGNGVVAISELIIGVNITLRSQPLSACPTFDRNDTGTVTVGELIQGVNNLLNGCPILP